MSDRAQMEIFGLVVIVILLSLGLLFAVVILSRPPSKETQNVKVSLQAANFLNTMMGTTSVSCGKRTVRELLQDCAVAGVERGKWIGAASCDKGNTCELAKDMIGDMLNQTLGVENKVFHFFINGTKPVELIDVENGKCEGEREGNSRPEKVRPGMDIILTLHICQS